MATGEKRSAAESEVAAHQECKAILLDVEGTTSSISFVKVSEKTKIRRGGRRAAARCSSSWAND